MIPANRYWAGRAAKQFVAGQRYYMAEDLEASSKSKRFFFAAIRQLWQNLPDDLHREYPTVEHLRKKLMLRLGFFKQRSFPCASRQEALQLRTWLREKDEYAILIVDGAVLIETTAESITAMTKARFKEMSDAMIGWLCDRTGIPVESLKREAQKDSEPSSANNA
jgi:hypothetical protein